MGIPTHGRSRCGAADRGAESTRHAIITKREHATHRAAQTGDSTLARQTWRLQRRVLGMRIAQRSTPRPRSSGDRRSAASGRNSARAGHSKVSRSQRQLTRAQTDRGDQRMSRVIEQLELASKLLEEVASDSGSKPTIAATTGRDAGCCAKPTGPRPTRFVTPRSTKRSCARSSHFSSRCRTWSPTSCSTFRPRSTIESAPHKSRFNKFWSA